MKTPSYQIEAGREIAKALNEAPRLRAEIRRLRRELRAARKL